MVYIYLKLNYNLLNFFIFNLYIIGNEYTYGNDMLITCDNGHQLNANKPTRETNTISQLDILSDNNLVNPEFESRGNKATH